MKYGAYLQVYKDDGNMVETVRSMNNNMPDCEIVVVSDGGDNFEKYKKNHTFQYIHDDYNIGSGASGFSKENMKVWLRRMRNAFEITKSDFMIYLEDDVRINSQFTIPEEWTIAGVCSTPTPQIYNDIISNSKYPGYLYGTCGGAIYKTETFLNEYDKILEFLDWYYDQGNYGYLDMFMPICYMVLGYKYSENVLLQEITNNSQTWDRPIIHLRPF